MVSEPSNASLLDTATQQPQQVSMRGFDDPIALRKAIFDRVYRAVQKRYPIENQKFRLELRNLRWGDDKDYSLAEQKQAIIQNRSLERRLVGEWTLVNKADNQVIDKKKTTVASVPWLTQRGTFISRGNEYIVANQIRLDPGVYTRKRENGVVESHFNIKVGTGPGFRIYMEPDTGIFRLGVGQATLKLYPILKAMGVNDKELEDTWGKDLLTRNIAADDPRAVSRAFTRLVRTRADQSVGGADTQAVEKIASYEDDYPRLDPDNTVFVDSYTDKYTPARGDPKHIELLTSQGSRPYPEDLPGLEEMFTDEIGELFGIPGVYMYEPDEFPIAGDYELRPSPIHGLGCFATRDFDSGETVGLAMVRDRDTDDRDLDYARTAIGRFINHAEGDQVNCDLYNYGRYVWLKTIRPVKAGEELLCDYKDAERYIHTETPASFIRPVLIGLNRVVKSASTSLLDVPKPASNFVPETKSTFPQQNNERESQISSTTDPTARKRVRLLKALTSRNQTPIESTVSRLLDST